MLDQHYVLKENMMKYPIVLACLVFVISSCSSDSSDNNNNGLSSTLNIIPVNGSTVPDVAELGIGWIRQGNDQAWESYVTTGGRLQGDRVILDAPNPIPQQVIGERSGVAVGILLAYPVGQSPTYGPHTDDDDPIANNAIGLAITHGIIYKEHDYDRSDSIDDDFVWWGDAFPLGYSCALSIDGGEEFDFFEPVDCSELELNIGVVSEMQLVGFDFT